MQIANIAVLLMYHPEGDRRRITIRALGDETHYHEYFFNLTTGHAAYWFKQSNGRLLLSGGVFPFAVFDEPAPRLIDGGRSEIAEHAIKHHEDRGVDFRGYDAVIVVLSMPRSPSDAGAGSARSKHGHIPIAVVLGEHGWDYIAHELAHTLGFQHSFGPVAPVNAAWEKPGEYRHPFCIMSAQSYAGNYPLFDPEPPYPPFLSGPSVGSPPASYARQGPGLNAGQAVGRGWLTTKEISASDIPDTGVEFQILSRTQWAFANRRFPQALIVKQSSDTFVIEYREPTGWETGLAQPTVILVHQAGSTAAKHFGDPSCSTYLGHHHIPSVMGTVVCGGKFCFDITAQDPFNHTATVRLMRTADRARMTTNQYQNELSRQVLETGTQNFDGQFCRSGTWTYSKDRVTREEIFEVRHWSIGIGTIATWQIDGREILNSSTVTLIKLLYTPEPDLGSRMDLGRIEVTCRKEVFDGGVRLRVSNPGIDPYFTYEVRVTVRSAVAQTERSWNGGLVGLEYRYPDEFDESYRRCMENLKRGLWEAGIPNVRVVLPPELWLSMDPRIRMQAEVHLLELSRAHAAKEAEKIKLLSDALARLTGVAVDDFLIFTQGITPAKHIHCDAPAPQTPPITYRKGDLEQG